VVLALLGASSYGLFRWGLQHRQAAWAAARQELFDLQVRREAARRQAVEVQPVLARAVRDKHLRLEVLGPARYQPGAPNPYRVTTTNLDGVPAAADVTVRLVDPNGQVLFETKSIPSSGDVLVQLPPDVRVPPQTAAQLEVVARGPLDRQEVHEQLPVAEPVYATHLATDKPVYQAGETVFFRSLTLDRFSLRPPDRELTVFYRVADPWGLTVFQTTGRLRPEGLGGGEFTMPANRPSGEYALTVMEAQGRFPVETRRFLYHSPQPVQWKQALEFDRTAYRPGDTVQATLVVQRAEGGAPYARQPLTATLEVEGRAPAPGASPGVPVVRTDAQGKALIRLSLPKDLATDRVWLKVTAGVGVQRESRVYAVPLADALTQVEFFPEGGDLVAGVPNRVYFRVRPPKGKAAEVRGHVADSQGREVAALSVFPDPAWPDANHKLGVFTLTPQAGETYALRLDSPVGVLSQSTLPPARSDGITLGLAEGLIREGQPIRVVLRQAGPERPVVLGVYCRGRLVATESVRSKPGQTEVQLSPPADVGGVLRLTVFEDTGKVLRPVAERLVYRIPSRRLVLSAEPNQPEFKPGEQVQLTIRAKTEQGEPIPAWLLVAVVSKARLEQAGAPRERSLPGYFHLATDVQHPEEWERADLWLADNPRSAAALDLLLGTQGWRRFADPKSQPALGYPMVASPRGTGPIDETPVLKLDNTDQVQRFYTAALAATLAAAQHAAAAKDTEFAEVERQLVDRSEETGTALATYRAQAEGWVRLGVGLVFLAFLAAGSLLFLWAFVRVLRGRTANTRYFAGAFASLLLCLLTGYGLLREQGLLNQPNGMDVGPGAVSQVTPKGQDEAPGAPRFKADLEADIGPAGAASRSSLLIVPEKTQAPAGRFNWDGRLAEASAEKTQADRANAGEDNRTPAGRTAVGPATSAVPATSASPPQSMRSLQPERLVPDLKMMKPAGALPARVAPAPGGAAELSLREYAFGAQKAAAGQESSFQGTVLWHPAVFAEGGTAQVTFTLPGQAAVYRLLACGHSLAGHLGAVEGVLAAGPAP
jgi:hypothetical protein